MQQRDRPECVQCGNKVSIEPDLLLCDRCDRAQEITEEDVMEAIKIYYPGAKREPVSTDSNVFKAMRSVLENFVHSRKAVKQ